ncbi:MAG: hypothetical protein LQ342_002682 [Letrouitia transgressa]|nr:MAG: hypothetical protein LQ342_002682 [Letrouitia transgressa]
MACPLSAILNFDGDAPRPNIRQTDSITPRTLGDSQRENHLEDESQTLSNRPNNRLNIFFPPSAGLSTRRDFEPPSPDPPPHELDFNQFSVFTALLNYPELIFEIAKHLEIEDLISLYAISRDFHSLMNSRFTTMIRSRAGAKAAESAKVFIFTYYSDLCIRDPARRPLQRAQNLTRSVPSFRYLRFILFRERVVNEIIACLAAEGLRLPKSTSIAIKKVWLIMDIPNNKRRTSMMREHIWSDKDLFLATMFFIKLDMMFTDPMRGEGNTGMRRMMLAQRSLSTLWRVLKREEMVSQLDVLRMLVKWHYRPPRPHLNLPILGVEPRDIGRLQYEGWGKNREKKMLGVDYLVAFEAVRRGLDIQQHHLDMMLHGFIDKQNVKNI